MGFQKEKVCQELRAAIAHAKQRVADGRYIGITEPGIIASEAPNAIVNPLVIMPDIEKRLEAFVRLGHGIVVFAGGAGTAEEILYLLGILLDPASSGKGAAGLIDLMRRGAFPKGQYVVFLHTGGAAGLFGYLPAFEFLGRTQDAQLTGRFAYERPHASL